MAGTEHILVDDDEEGIRLQLDEFLTSEGYRVTVVPDGVGLRQVMDNGGIDLVLLDLHLPGEDGTTIARNYLSKTDVGVIMLTSRTEVMDRVVGLEVGANPHEGNRLVVRSTGSRWRSRFHGLPTGRPAPLPRGG